MNMDFQMDYLIRYRCVSDECLELVCDSINEVKYNWYIAQ